MRLMVVLAVIGFGLVGCSLKVNDKEVASVGGGGDRTEDSYDFTSNGCPTGHQQFSGTGEEVRNAMCAALQDEARNRGCAQELREQLFATKCPGQQFKPRYRSTRGTAELAEELLGQVRGLREEERAEAVQGLTELISD